MVLFKRFSTISPYAAFDKNTKCIELKTLLTDANILHGDKPFEQCRTCALFVSWHSGCSEQVLKRMWLDSCFVPSTYDGEMIYKAIAPMLPRAVSLIAEVDVF